MRLICPNCGAQYEVEDSVIPENGRDVQCSNCGHTWYQRHPGMETKPAPKPAAQPTVEPEVTSPAAKDVEPTPGEAPQSEAAQTEAEPSVEPSLRPRRRPLDKEVANILREEAEREAAVRARETAPPIESQPGLGLETPDDSAIRDRMAKLRGQGEETAAPEDAEPLKKGSKRRDLLPDIEELNSTLTAEPEEPGSAEGEIVQEEKRRSGFRIGFSLTVLLFAAMALVYVYSPKITDAYPQSADYLAAYVDWVNGIRQGIDAILQRAVDKLTILISQISKDGG